MGVQCNVHVFVRNQFTKYKISLRHTRFKRFKFVFWIEYNELGCFSWRLRYCMNIIECTAYTHIHGAWTVQLNCSQINYLQERHLHLQSVCSPVHLRNRHYCMLCEKCHFWHYLIFCPLIKNVFSCALLEHSVWDSISSHLRQKHVHRIRNLISLL